MAPSTFRTHRVEGIAGVLAVALLLFGTRWGSYLGYAPLFLTDVLIFLAIGRLFLSKPKSGWGARPGRTQFPGWAVTVLFLYVIFRALLSNHVLTMDWARDMVPFLYVGLAFISSSTYAQAGPSGRARTMKILWWALNGHLAWTLLVNFGWVEATSMPTVPGSTLAVFDQRPDADMAVLGMTVALYLRKFILGQQRVTALVGLSLCIVAIGGFESRAGLLAVLAATAVSFTITVGMHDNFARKYTWIVLAPALLLVVAMVLPQTSAGQRLLVTVGVEEATALNQRDALGTARARELAWEETIEWVQEDPSRVTVGTGFGPNFLLESGAGARMLGATDEKVRSPHNWFIGLYARLGMLGVALVVLVLMTVLAHTWRIRKLVAYEEVLTLAATGVTAILVAASFGVILESPFGAVPFWWFVGILMAERRRIIPACPSSLRESGKLSTSAPLSRDVTLVRLRTPSLLRVVRER
ncbi:O-antigen ligase family protein [Kocuria rosea]|uniref:O-antigen ligase family protein n=1 Tax=Kocuria rosea TaxID=1275 RepID=UPI000E05229D|nr:O-antigen ligase family protein [Kocuria rosea]STX04976.1 O-Antigen ligase [Kocuria rosea]